MNMVYLSIGFCLLVSFISLRVFWVQIFYHLSSVAQSCPNVRLFATPCRPLLLLPLIPPSIRVFSNESTLRIRWQSIGVSASTSVLPMNTQDWCPSGWTGWISLQSKGLSTVFSNTTVQLVVQFFGTQLSLWSNFHICTHIYAHSVGREEMGNTVETYI